MSEDVRRDIGGALVSPGMKTIGFASLAILAVCSACSGDAQLQVDPTPDAQAPGDSSAAPDSAGKPIADASAPDTSDAADAAPPMCLVSADCAIANVSYPNGNGSMDPTSCARGVCGLATTDTRFGALGSKTPVTCNTVCAASTYKGKPMVCAPTCGTKTINGFGDKGLVYDDGSDGGTNAGSLGGMATYQFNSISGAYQFVDLGCSAQPAPQIVVNGNGYKYSAQACCCEASP